MKNITKPLNEMICKHGISMEKFCIDCKRKGFTPKSNNHSPEKEVEPENINSVTRSSSTKSASGSSTPNISEIKKDISVILECIRYNPMKYDNLNGFWLTSEFVLKIDKLLKATLSTMIECKKEELERVKKLLEEIGDKFYYHSEIDGVDLKLNDLTEYEEFKEQRISQLQDEIGEMNKNG